MQYFSSGLVQKGDVTQGLSGFLVADVLAEVRRGGKKKMICIVCRKPGKYVGCEVTRCLKGGHFPCLVKANYVFQHYDTFCTYCPAHAPTQTPLSNVSESCCICLTPLSASILYCPSCHTHFHKDCVQVDTHPLTLSLFFPLYFYFSHSLPLFFSFSSCLSHSLSLFLTHTYTLTLSLSLFHIHTLTAASFNCWTVFLSMLSL